MLSLNFQFKSGTSWAIGPGMTVYFSGGYIYGIRYKDCYLLANKALTKLSPMKHERSHHCCLFTENAYYVFGGYGPIGGSFFSAEVMHQNGWSPMPGMIYEKEYPSCALLNRKIYISSFRCNRIEVYDLRSTTWSILPEVVPVETRAVFVHKNDLFILHNTTRNSCIAVTFLREHIDPDRRQL